MENEVPPPSSSIPPLIAPPPPPPARPRRKGWVILAVVLGAVFLLLVVNPLVQLFWGDQEVQTGSQSGRVFEEVVVEHNASRNKILIVDVDGVISSEPWDSTGRNMVDVIEDQLKAARKDDAIRAVILKVDSPGGEVLASDDISRAIANFQNDTQKPVIAAMGGMAASGGYYIAAPCSWIVANELTITGSIGVIMHSFNYRGLLDKVGVYPQVFKSGKFKDMLSGSKRPEEVTAEEQRMVQSMIDETHLKFKSVVKEGRARAISQNPEARALAPTWEEYADGRVLTGKQAYEIGFVDELGNFETAVKRAKALAEIHNAKLIRYKEPFDFGSLFSLLGQSQSKSIKIDLGMEMPKLQVGRLYFLSSTVLH